MTSPLTAFYFLVVEEQIDSMMPFGMTYNALLKGRRSGAPRLSVWLFILHYNLKFYNSIKEMCDIRRCGPLMNYSFFVWPRLAPWTVWVTQIQHIDFYFLPSFLLFFMPFLYFYWSVLDHDCISSILLITCVI